MALLSLARQVAAARPSRVFISLAQCARALRNVRLQEVPRARANLGGHVANCYTRARMHRTRERAASMGVNRPADRRGTLAVGV